MSQQSRLLPMAFKTINIAYSGSLDAFLPQTKSGVLARLKQWFWTYKHDTVDASTRSAYYLIQAVGILKTKYAIGPDQLNIDLWGKIHPANLKQAKQAGVADYFKIEDYLSKEISLARLAKADILFLPLEKSNTKGTHTLFIPGKLFEYLNTGKPILALCEDSDCKTILEASGLGICVAPDEPEQIAETLYQLITNEGFINHYSPNANYISQFSFENKTAELARVFDRLIVK